MDYVFDYKRKKRGKLSIISYEEADELIREAYKLGKDVSYDYVEGFLGDKMFDAGDFRGLLKDFAERLLPMIMIGHSELTGATYKGFGHICKECSSAICKIQLGTSPT